MRHFRPDQGAWRSAYQKIRAMPRNTEQVEKGATPLGRCILGQPALFRLVADALASSPRRAVHAGPICDRHPPRYSVDTTPGHRCRSRLAPSPIQCACGIQIRVGLVVGACPHTNPTPRASHGNTDHGWIGGGGLRMWPVGNGSTSRLAEPRGAFRAVGKNGRKAPRVPSGSQAAPTNAQTHERTCSTGVGGRQG